MAGHEDREYVTLIRAARELGTHREMVKLYAQRGLIGVRRLPDSPPRYCLADLHALAARCTRPARVEPEAVSA